MDRRLRKANAEGHSIPLGPYTTHAEPGAAHNEGRAVRVGDSGVFLAALMILLTASPVRTMEQPPLEMVACGREIHRRHALSGLVVATDLPPEGGASEGEIECELHR